MVFLVWAADEGGYPPTAWYPGALLVTALLVTLHVARPMLMLGPPRLSWMATGLFALFAAWNFLSISWAGSKGDAWDGANRTLLYVLVYTLFARWPWRPRGAAILLGLYAVGVAVVGLLTLQQAIDARDLTSFFIGSRLSEPAGYPNATAALFLVAFWPVLFLSSLRKLAPLLRGALLGVAGVLLELSIIPQSCGALLSLPIAAVLYLVLVPGRARALIHVALVGAAAALALDPLLGVYRASARAGALSAALGDARDACILSFAALVLAGSALALLDSRVNLSARVTSATNRLLAVAAVAAAVGGLAVLLAFGSPSHHARTVWNDFKSSEPRSSSSHLVGLGSNRYDFWRVSLTILRNHPIGGAGADNFAVDYLRHRRSQEEPLYTHSFEMRLLAHTGIVGTLIFAAFLGAALLAAWRGRSRGEVLKRGIAATATAAFAYWFVHGSGDWLWEFPALSAPAFAWLGLATGLDRTPRVEPLRARRLISRLAAATTIVVALLAAVSFALPWVAARDVNIAAHTWRADPDGAFAALDRARRLNMLTDLPDVTAGVIASRLGDLRRMRVSFVRALARNPDNWYSHLELGVVYTNEREYRRAVDQLRQARALNPREPLVSFVLDRAVRRRSVSPAVVDRVLLDRARAITQ